MSDENESTAVDADSVAKTISPDDPDFEALKEMRAVEKEKDRAKLRTTVEQLQKQLAGLQSEKQKAEEAKAREAQDWVSLEKAYVAERDDLRRKLDELQSTLQARETNDRRTAFLDKVAADAGIPNDVVFRGALREIAELESIDLAPEKVTEQRSKAVQSLLRRHAPALFVRTQAKTTPPADQSINGDASKASPHPQVGVPLFRNHPFYKG